MSSFIFSTVEKPSLFFLPNTEKETQANQSQTAKSPSWTYLKPQGTDPWSGMDDYLEMCHAGRHDCSKVFPMLVGRREITQDAQPACSILENKLLIQSMQKQPGLIF